MSVGNYVRVTSKLYEGCTGTIKEIDTDWLPMYPIIVFVEQLGYEMNFKEDELELIHD